MNVIKNIIKSCKTNIDFSKAKNALKVVEKNINELGMIFPNISSFDFHLKKNEWATLPPEVAEGVQTMGIHIGDDYRSLIVHYQPHSFILPHYHSSEYEVVKVIEGSVKNVINGELYVRGDIVIIPKNKLHHIITLEEESYMYILFTEYSEYLKLPHNEEELAQSELLREKRPS